MAQTVPVRVQETDFTADRVDAYNASASNAQSYGAITQVAPEPEAQSDAEPQQPSAAPAAADAPSFTRTARLLAPDLLRGLLMVLQSIDHGSVSSGAWRHGQALETEGDSIPVDTWNDPVPWTMRSLTHLCASGFMFLLGFGVVMFGRSRAKLGWSARALVWHFFIRAVVLSLCSEVLGLFLTGFRVYLFNVVLMSLGVNYLLAGLLWLLTNTTETTLTAALDSWLSPKASAADEQPLLNTEAASSAHSTRAASISFWLHNAALAVLAFITIAWNKWMSPTDGHCQLHAKVATNTAFAAAATTTSRWGLAWDFWWYSVMDVPHGVVSGFPPLAWLSFAVVGVLYARIYLARPWSAGAVAAANAAAAAFFALVFVATRLLHLGNLTEGCLRMPEQGDHAGNQFLASFRAFFYVAKYPPDAGFFSYTLALNLALLAFFGALPAWFATRIPTLLVFGKCALFFYIVHMFVYTNIGALDKMWFGRKLGYPDPFNGGEAVGIGNGPVFWVSWLIGLAIMYPLCYYYGNFKSKKGPDSIWRFF